MFTVAIGKDYRVVGCGQKKDWEKRKINQNLPDTKDPLIQLRPFLTQSDSIMGAWMMKVVEERYLQDLKWVFFFSFCVSLIVSHLHDSSYMYIYYAYILQNSFGQFRVC